MVIMCNMTVIICTSCQTRNICIVASPWSRRLPLDSLHHPGAHASHPPTQEWKGPGTRQYPSRVSYPLWPKMSGMAQALRGFYSNCFSNLTKPKIWRNATVIAIPKFNKPTDDPENYRPISLLCVPFKLLERLLLARLEPIIDPHLPDEQAGFRRGRSTVHQIFNLTHDIEEPSKTATRQAWSWWTSQLNMTRYGTRALPWSYPWPSPCAVHLYYHLQPQLYTQDKRRTGRPIASTQKWGPPGSVLAPTLFNMYLSDLPSTSSSKYAYADDLALPYFDINWTTVKLDGSTLPYNSTPIFLRVKLDRQLTFK